MAKKTKYLQLRLTEEEAAKLKKKAENHASVSQYILTAVNGFSNVSVTERFDLSNKLAEKYQKFWNELASESGNITQAVKRTSELVDAGKVAPFFLERVVRPEVNKTMDLINEIRKKLNAVAQKATRLRAHG